MDNSLIDDTDVSYVSSRRNTVDSIRLGKHASRMSVASIDWPSDTVSDSRSDLDINALDSELQQLSLDIAGTLRELRKDPQNRALREALASSEMELARIKEWSSLLKTAEGLAIVREGMHKKRLIDINKRKYEIDEVLKTVKAQSTADVCFLMDCTGSMSRYIDATKTQIHTLTASIFRMFSTKVRLAFIGYRDINESLEQLDFTEDTNIFKAFLDTVKATGGGDTCEDVFSGLEAITKLSWSNPNRLLIHICDAPCHGRDYHELQSTNADQYPKGDPNERELSKLLLDIKRLSVTYCSIQLNDSTRKMFEEFAFIFGQIFEIHINDPACLIKHISEKTSALILSSIDSTMSTYRTENYPTKMHTILGKEPDWNVLEVVSVETIEIFKPNRLDDLFRPMLIGQGSGQMKIAPNPFAKGSLRFAFYGLFCSDEFPLFEVVFKEFISANPKANTLVVYRQHLEIQVIAQFLAEQFNIEQRRIFKNSIPVVFADADLVQSKTDKSKIYQVERRMHQEWRKWNNNSGLVSMSEYSTVLQAFSHWTYHITAGRLMVVDLQGVKAEDAYLLSDPALHCDDLLRFRETRTNLGVKGMREFFRTHMCSEVCSKLNLPPPSVQSLPSSSVDINTLLCRPRLETLDENALETLEDASMLTETT